MYKIRFQHSVALLLCLITSVALALPMHPSSGALASTKLPKHYPLSFDISGTITKANKKNRVISLDGTAYKLHPVHDIFTRKKNRKATLFNLKPGMKIGGKFSTFQDQKVIYKIWILPKDYPTMQHAH